MCSGNSGPFSLARDEFHFRRIMTPKAGKLIWRIGGGRVQTVFSAAK